MKELFRNIPVPRYGVVVSAFLCMTIIFGVLFWVVDVNGSPKLSVLVGGIFSAFVVALVQLLVTLWDAKKLSSYEKMGVQRVLPDRRDSHLYEAWIKQAESRICVMGVTASRLLEDFGKVGGRSTAIREALARGVKVKILLPKKCWLQNKHASSFQETTLPLADELSSEFEGFEIRYFDSAAAHSIFLVDDICVVGPVFKGVDSKDTPAIVIGAKSQFARPYVDLFEKEWAGAIGEPD